MVCLRIRSRAAGNREKRRCLPKERVLTAIAEILNRVFQETNKTILYPFPPPRPAPATDTGLSLLFPRIQLGCLRASTSPGEGGQSLENLCKGGGGSQVVTLRVRHVWISSVRGLPPSQACVSEPAVHYSP